MLLPLPRKYSPLELMPWSRRCISHLISQRASMTELEVNPWVQERIEVSFDFVRGPDDGQGFHDVLDRLLNLRASDVAVKV